MTAYVIHRLLQTLAVLGLMSVAVYGLIWLMPGDPIDLMVSANPDLTAADAARLRALYGLDRPFAERYLAWLQAALGGDLGYSRQYARPVLEIIGPRMVNTLILVGLSFVASVALAFPLGLIAARRPYSAADNAVNLFCFAGISIPPFWLALLLMMGFSVGLGWLPAGGLPAEGGLGAHAAHLVLPVATLTLGSVAAYARFIRGETIAALRQDFVRTAQAKGATPWRVLTRHALRNALIPVVTVIGLHFGTVFSGALITETMFAYPGMGKLIYDSIMGNDFNLALVGLLFVTLITLLSNLAADLLYIRLDPRVSYESART
jgi:peptide/nickel transport system permease protein